MRALPALLAMSAVLATSAIPGQALAQVGGGKVVHIIVPFAAGGVQDILARSISNELGTVLGQTVIVENKPGAGGTVGTGQVARAPADGLTVVMAAASHQIAPYLYSKLGYDPNRDFVPAAYIGTASYVLMIPASVPANSVGEFVQYAKANPGKLNYATAGNGSATHLAMAYFTGLEVSHEPGQWSVWAGVILMGLGLALVFYFVHVRLWAVPVRDARGTLQLWIGGTSNKNKDAFENRFRDLVAQIESELKISAGTGPDIPVPALAGK